MSSDLTSATPNGNRCWAHLIVEACLRSGVDTFFIAPGSRSTPLTTAVAAHPHTRAVMHFDERGTAFAALGYGRATRKPAGWITTSGTALANGYPAIVEASVDDVPMLLLTADRPFELRDTGANQTIDQVRIFGTYPRWFTDLPTPSTAVEPEVVVTTLEQAVYRTGGARPGPVHVNCMFRKPLAPVSDGTDWASYLQRMQHWLEDTEPYTTYSTATRIPEHEAAAWANRLQQASKGLIIAGRLRSVKEGDAVLLLADRLGWPVLPDVHSFLRLGTGQHPLIQASYDLWVDSDTFRVLGTPDIVLHVGHRATSKRLSQALSALRPSTYITVHGSPLRLDPHHQVTHRVEADVHAWCRAVAAAMPENVSKGGWNATWTTYRDRAADEVASVLAATSFLNDIQVARSISTHIPESHAWVVASSMPVRDVDAFALTTGARVPVYANRGASGIDGLVATAFGVAEGRQAPATLLIGDLALLHDLNSLALLRNATYPVIVVIINNDGGGIFHYLPIAAFDDVFEPNFATPHALTFAHAAKQFDLAYQAPDSLAAFEQTYQEACAKGQSMLIEVSTDREQSHRLHQDLEAAVTSVLRGLA